jgi:hypothetical protein
LLGAGQYPLGQRGRVPRAYSAEDSCAFTTLFRPIRVPNLGKDVPVTRLAGSGASRCAIAGDSVYCWGSNALGQLGIGTRGEEASPVEVDGLPDPENPSEVTAAPEGEPEPLPELKVSGNLNPKFCPPPAGGAQ